MSRLVRYHTINTKVWPITSTAHPLRITEYNPYANIPFHTSHTATFMLCHGYIDYHKAPLCLIRKQYTSTQYPACELSLSYISSALSCTSEFHHILTQIETPLSVNLQNRNLKTVHPTSLLCSWKPVQKPNDSTKQFQTKKTQQHKLSVNTAWAQFSHSVTAGCCCLPLDKRKQ